MSEFNAGDAVSLQARRLNRALLEEEQNRTRAAIQEAIHVSVGSRFAQIEVVCQYSMPEDWYIVEAALMITGTRGPHEAGFFKATVVITHEDIVCNTESVLAWKTFVAGESEKLCEHLRAELKAAGVTRVEAGHLSRPTIAARAAKAARQVASRTTMDQLEEQAAIDSIKKRTSS